MFTLLGRYLRLLGKVKEAIVVLNLALQHAKTMGMPYEAALTHFQLSHCHKGKPEANEHKTLEIAELKELA